MRGGITVADKTPACIFAWWYNDDPTFTQVPSSLAVVFVVEEAAKAASNCEVNCLSCTLLSFMWSWKNVEKTLKAQSTPIVVIV